MPSMSKRPMSPADHERKLAVVRALAKLPLGDRLKLIRAEMVRRGLHVSEPELEPERPTAAEPAAPAQE